MKDYQKILEEVYHEVQSYIGDGKVANYIPALEKVSPDKFGMALRTFDGREFHIGNYEENFSIQSISKLFVLTLAMNLTGGDRWQRVGIEPSGTSFNSLVQLEQDEGRPRNPFINAGAIVTTDILYDFFKKPKSVIKEFLRTQSGNDTVDVNQRVYHSEQETGFINYSLAYYMKSLGNLHNEVEEVLNTYFYHCSFEMSCIDLTRTLHYLMNSGIDRDGKRVVSPEETRRINALMLTCGSYDNAGQVAYKIGIPTKSGVGGGVVGVLPGNFTVAVWSPSLNSAGNSRAGTKALEILMSKLDVSIF